LSPTEGNEAKEETVDRDQRSHVSDQRWSSLCLTCHL